MLDAPETVVGGVRPSLCLLLSLPAVETVLLLDVLVWPRLDCDVLAEPRLPDDLTDPGSDLLSIGPRDEVGRRNVV